MIIILVQRVCQDSFENCKWVPISSLIAQYVAPLRLIISIYPCEVSTTVDRSNSWLDPRELLCPTVWLARQSRPYSQSWEASAPRRSYDQGATDQPSHFRCYAYLTSAWNTPRLCGTVCYPRRWRISLCCASLAVNSQLIVPFLYPYPIPMIWSEKCTVCYDFLAIVCSIPHRCPPWAQLKHEAFINH